MIEKKFIDVRITAISEQDLKDVLILLRKISYCGEIGADRLIPVRVDGDGSGIIGIDLIDGDILKNIDEVVVLDKDALKKVDDGEDFETHYIGE